MKYILLIFNIFLCQYLFAQNSVNNVGLTSVFQGQIIDSESGEPLDYALVSVVGTKKATLTGDGGRFIISNVSGESIELSVSYVGYCPATYKMPIDEGKVSIIRLVPQKNSISEVVVTAHESHGIVVASKISRDQMEHVQPTSITDLMSLLPGGTSNVPDMSSVNSIRLRETGVVGATGSVNNNAMSSLGTLFVVDGAPINGDSNMQQVQGSTSGDESYGRDMTNRGVDMRTISTDDIESVEVVRGIPSVEYGNLTSGMVVVNRIRKTTPMIARFKADQYGKLISVGKGFRVSDNSVLINLNGSYLDSKTDPRNPLENYKRATASARLTFSGSGETADIECTPGADFTGSFDNSKVDPDLTYRGVDRYESKYRRLAISNGLKIKPSDIQFLKSISLDMALSYQHDVLERTKLVSPDRAMIAPIEIPDYIVSQATGADAVGVETEGTYIVGEYIADYKCDGKPLNAYSKMKIDFDNLYGASVFKGKVGVEWNLSKNLGGGQQYDISRPLSSSWSHRPRRYKDIPAIQNLSIFVEESMTSAIGNSKLEIQGGVRMQRMIGLDSKYALSSTAYFDPRVNMLWTMPEFSGFIVGIGGGWGMTTKLPTQAYLYPEFNYLDLVQLNYYSTINPVEYSKVSLMTYVIDQANYQLEAARNRKWELRMDIAWHGHRLTASYFSEKMSTGYCNTDTYDSYHYKKYDASTIDGLNVNAKPDLASLAYSEVDVLRRSIRPSNDVQIGKEGVEYQYQSERIKPLRTSVVINGAWYKTSYLNSKPYYWAVSSVINNQALSDLYVGQYERGKGKRCKQFNTNFMLDTQIPEIGFVFSTTIENVWFISSQTLYESGVPIAYMSYEDGKLHQYDSETTGENHMLAYLERKFSSGMFRVNKVPRASYVNLKATKNIADILRISFFANKLLDSTPDYTVDGAVVRRHVNPYFGMEANIKL